MFPRPTIEAFDLHLAEHDHQFEAVVIGGAALVLLEVIHRATRDFDILAPEVPQHIALAARSFASAQRLAGFELVDEWLNNGPLQLAQVLPPNWQERLQPLYAGRALKLSTLGRLDLLKSKLFALCDRGTDLSDCVALHPKSQELSECLPWLVQQDANVHWPEHVRATLADLERRLRHGV